MPWQILLLRSSSKISLGMQACPVSTCQKVYPLLELCIP